MDRPWEVGQTREIADAERALFERVDLDSIMIPEPYPWEPQRPEPTFREMMRDAR